MKSGQAVDERVAVSPARCSPCASPLHRRRTAGPLIRGMTAVYEDPHLLFSLPTEVQGAGSGGPRQRTRAGLDREPFDLFSPPSSLN
jgi:hypothetical protein